MQPSLFAFSYQEVYTSAVALESYKRYLQHSRSYCRADSCLVRYLHYSNSQSSDVHNFFANVLYVEKYFFTFALNLDNWLIIEMNKLFKALDDATRRQILDMLKQKDLTAGEIADAFAISKPSISYHLDLLKQAELVVAVRRGQFIYYSLNTTVLDDVVAWMVTLLREKEDGSATALT